MRTLVFLILAGCASPATLDPGEPDLSPENVIAVGTACLVASDDFYGDVTVEERTYRVVDGMEVPDLWWAVCSQEETCAAGVAGLDAVLGGCCDVHVEGDVLVGELYRRFVADVYCP